MRSLVEDGAFVLTGNGIAEDIRCAGLKPGGAILDTTTLWRGLNAQGFLPELGTRSSLGHMAMLLSDTSCPYYDHKCKASIRTPGRQGLREPGRDGSPSRSWPRSRRDDGDKLRSVPRKVDCRMYRDDFGRILARGRRSHGDITRHAFLNVSNT
ncbi:unnamed protein product [Sphagnum tenellum]